MYMSRKKKIDDSLGNKILNYYLNDNLSASKISKIINISTATICSYLKEHKINVINHQMIPKIDEHLGDIIIRYYTIDKLSISMISKQIGIGIGTICKYLKSQQVEIINYQNRTKFDETVFDNIDSSEKAYWLGFIFADGYISSRDNSFELSLGLKDIAHLHKFNHFMKHENDNVKISITRTNKRCRWEITNKHLWNTLNNLGCIPKKSLTLKFPNILEKWYKDFIRGYFDGDGCLSFHRKERKPKVDMIGTIEFLTQVQNILSQIGIVSKINQDKRMSSLIGILTISQTYINNFLDYIYKDCSICLDRKYKRYEFFKISRSDKELSEFLESEIGEGCDANTEVN